MTRGINNLGNTCFINTCLQILLNTQEIIDLPETPINNNDIDSSFFKEWIHFKNEMNVHPESAFHPERFIRCIHHTAKLKNQELFMGFSQNDMSEFLLFFMDCIHICFQRGIETQINGTIQNNTDIMAVSCFKLLENIYKNDYSEIKHLFHGIQVSRLIHTDCNTILSCRPESFFIIDLPIFGPSIYTCLDKTISIELLENENAWFNETTQQKESVYKQTVFWNFPKILVISFQRFFVKDNHIYKNMDLIDFPIDNLDLSRYVQGYHASTYVYDLYAICNHIGNVTDGHYTAFIKKETNEWIHCNDHLIERVMDPKQIITPMTYCLFYRMKS
jgi:ubiquitin carboxyl-terminal hydrolase 8